MFNPHRTGIDTLEPVVFLPGIPGIALKKITDHFINSYTPVAVRNNCQVMNEVPEKLSVHTDEHIFREVMKGLLCAVINNAKDTCIRISARIVYGSKVELIIKDPNSYHTYAIACGLQAVIPVAEKIRGDINITNQREKITTISLTFPTMM